MLHLMHAQQVNEGVDPLVDRAARRHGWTQGRQAMMSRLLQRVSDVANKRSRSALLDSSALCSLPSALPSCALLCFL